MANSPQARKRARQNSKRRARNMSQRSSLRTAIKKFLRLASATDASAERDQAVGAYRDAASRIDRAASKGLHHKNRAARLKKRLNNRLKSLNA
ncbi:MAG: 30S ribosomal protein S20 [bacterium]